MRRERRGGRRRGHIEPATGPCGGGMRIHGGEHDRTRPFAGRRGGENGVAVEKGLGSAQLGGSETRRADRPRARGAAVGRRWRVVAGTGSGPYHVSAFQERMAPGPAADNEKGMGVTCGSGAPCAAARADAALRRGAVGVAALLVIIVQTKGAGAVKEGREGQSLANGEGAIGVRGV